MDATSILAGVVLTFLGLHLIGRYGYAVTVWWQHMTGREQ